MGKRARKVERRLIRARLLRQQASGFERMASIYEREAMKGTQLLGVLVLGGLLLGGIYLVASGKYQSFIGSSVTGGTETGDAYAKGAPG